MRATACATAVAWVLALGACGGTPDGPPDTAVDAASDAEVPPTFTPAEWTVLRQLAPDPLPAPPRDVSNQWADDPAAAALGRRLFMDPGFSGALLDVDNDGGPNSLGRRGESGRVACAGCHMERSAFLDTRSTFQQISLGTGWTLRRTPSLLDVGQARLVAWGGRHSTLQSQVFAPLENPLEMNSSRLYAAHWIADHYRAEYEALFGTGALAPLADTARFPRLPAERTGCSLTRSVDQPRALPPDPMYECHGMPGDHAEYDGMAPDDQDRATRIVINAGKAIAAFERTLRCPPGRFDAFVHGDAAALSAAEQRGLQLFLGRGRCVSCHSGPYLSDQGFHNVGVAERATREGILNANDRGASVDLVAARADPVGVASRYSDGDDGRVPATVPPEYEGAFRTPTLRCVRQRPTFMHSGLLESLDGVVEFFDRGGDASGYRGTRTIAPLGLTAQDRRDLVAFLNAL